MNVRFATRLCRVKILVVLTALAFLFLAACVSDEQPTPVDLTKKAEVSRTQDAHTITYAYLPQYSHSVAYQRHNPLIEYLKKETGLSIRQIFPDTFDEHMKMVGQGKIDISFSNPVAYVKVAHLYGSRAFARIIEEDGKANFRGQIICRKDNKAINTIEDCRGKRWIAVDPTSAGGYQFALGLFYDHGIYKRSFSEIAFSPGPGGKSEKVVLSVYAGRYDVGSVREGTLDVVAGKIDLSEIRVIASTPWYPGWVYSARKGLDASVVEKITDALLKLDRRNPEHEAILKAAHINGAIVSGDRDFDPVRDLLKKTGIDLEK
jgi:phosphonate transport system substrate-binding protein